jgi:hypothetical protein
MISGVAMTRWPTLTALITASMILLSNPVHGAPPDASHEALRARLAALAKSETGTVRFVELRDSVLLDTPTRSDGELAQPEPGVLVRRVDAPEPETTTIDGGRVRIERADGSSRRFSLRRAPELEALLASFRAILENNAELLLQHYQVETTGDDHAWQIGLTPKDARLAEKIEHVELSGSGAELRCLRMRESSGAGSLMLLDRAATEVPADTTIADLLPRCGRAED